MAETLLRLVFSLAVVLGLLLLTARVARTRLRGPADAPVRVVHRQGLTRGSSVVVVSVGDRLLLLGATEHQVQVLAELTPEELAAGSTGLSAVRVLPGGGSPSAPSRGSPPFGRLLQQAEADEELGSAPGRPGRHAARTPAVPRAGDGAGPLAGSLLSPRTWRQAAQVVAGRAS
jgi:flagellar protein FliO/FliZ